MDRAALRAVVILNTNRRDKADLINTALNLAVNDLARRHVFADLCDSQDVAAAADSVSVSLPDGTRNIVELRLINGQNSYPMHLREKSWVVARAPDPASAVSSGQPVNAYVEGGTLFFDRKTAADYTIRFTRRAAPTAMAADGDSPAISNADDALIAYATAYVFRSIGMATDAATWQAQYLDAAGNILLDDMRDPGMEHQSDGAAAIGTTMPCNPLDPFAGLPGSNW